MQNSLHMIRLIICGDSFTGKSCIIRKFIRSDEIINTTIGVEFFTKNYQLNENELKLLIWDTAGGHKFRTIVNRYFRGSNGVILVFDVSSKESFKNSLPNPPSLARDLNGPIQKSKGGSWVLGEEWTGCQKR